jgi:hypothetical protein
MTNIEESISGKVIRVLHEHQLMSLKTNKIPNSRNGFALYTYTAIAYCSCGVPFTTTSSNNEKKVIYSIKRKYHKHLTDMENT